MQDLPFSIIGDFIYFVNLWTKFIYKISVNILRRCTNLATQRASAGTSNDQIYGDGLLARSDLGGISD